MSTVVNYPAVNRDSFGEEKTIIQNDGKTLRMSLRGIEFSGFMFDDFEPRVIDEAKLTSFPLRAGTLCSYQLNCQIPVSVVVFGNLVEGSLQAHIEIGDPTPNGGVDLEQIELTLTVGDKTFKSSGTHGWFDDELLEIQAALPEDMFMKCCHTCAFSDYHPVGYGAFGGLACFRDHKQEYLAIKDKVSLMHFFSKLTENVQETYLCPEFEKRVPGTGYRG